MSGLLRAAPTTLGLDEPVLERYLDALETHGCHLVMVLRHGKVALEGWWEPYAPEYDHIAYSLSKSFVSVAMGFAQQEGLLTVDDRLVDFFPERFSNPPCENMRRVTIRDLLTMDMGHRGRTDHDFYHAPDWLDEILHLYLENVPGENFFYDNRCTYLCSQILTRLTGQTIYDYLTPRLFVPLGCSDLWWESKDGVNPGGWGLNLKTEDIARFGQFLLNRGAWDGKQLLDPAWIDTAGSRLVENAGISVYDWPDWEQGYGYYFWQCQPEKVYRGDGAFGQFVIVAPEQDMVVAITAGTNRACDLLTDTWIMFADAITDHPQASPTLAQRAGALRIPLAEGETSAPAHLHECFGKTYVFPKNAAGFRTLSVTPGETDVLCIETETGVFSARAGHGHWVENDTGYERDAFNAMTSFLYSDAACCAAWEGETYVLRLAFTRTPYVDTMRVRFAGAAVQVTYQCEPCLPLRHDCVTLVGTAEGLF